MIIGLLKYITDSNYRFVRNAAIGKYINLPDKEYIERMFCAKMGYELDLNNPKTFNEKIQWLKLFDRNPEYSRMVDKYEVKGYISEKIGEKYSIPLLGVWEHVEDVDFDSLPNEFVLKCTHDSHGLVICKNKKQLDVSEAKKTLNKALNSDYYHRFREWPYKNVKPRIIAEQFMSNEGHDLIDYKVHCFNGEPKIVLVCADRFADTGLTEDFYDCDWNHLSVSRPQHPNAKNKAKRPEKLEEMLEISRTLSEAIPFLRVDFYIINGDLYIGELTFFPASGFQRFEPDRIDLEWGNWLVLPVMNE